MARILKALGLTLTAVFALSAVSASGASAAGLTAFNTVNNTHESYTITTQIIKTNEEGHVFTATPGGPAVTCEKVSFSSTGTGTDEAPTVEPSYSECHASLLGSTRTAHVRMHGCHYVFHATTEVSENMEYTGTADLTGCENTTEEGHTNNQVEVEVTNTKGENQCTDTIAAQTGINKQTYETTTNVAKINETDVDHTSSANNVKNTLDKGLLSCGASAGEHNDGTYIGDTTVKALNTEGKQIDLTVMKTLTT
jgi:hypothetical protein